MLNTEKWGCRQLAAALDAFGISQVVTSPGSRNAPLLMAVERHPSLKVYSVIDERSAAFMALGMAEISNRPVALICTSGSALLNYAPAVAEAYYKQIPLIVVSADRPAEWIDQDDSQTIRQPGILAHIVKRSFSLKGEAGSDGEKWFINRTLNDAIIESTLRTPGPVHINMAVDNPLTAEAEVPDNEPFRKISLFSPAESISDKMARDLASELCGKKTLIVTGFCQPSNRLTRAIDRLSSLPNVAVITEGLSNIHSPKAISSPDIIIRSIGKHAADCLCPDVVITFGGALVSAELKQFIRQIHPSEHWHVGVTSNTIDCYKALTRRFDIAAEHFFPHLASSLNHLTAKGKNTGSYAGLWQAAAKRCDNATAVLTKRWGAPGAVKNIIEMIPSVWNIQLSNGMSVRYAQLCNLSRIHRTDCNRGVSGIDGSVSTAVGASMMYKNPTLLLIGDMSMQYDLGALTCNYLTPRLKIIVFNNGGGGIFRQIKTTSGLQELPHLFNGRLNLHAEQLAEAFGLKYLCAADYESLQSSFSGLAGTSDRPVLLEVISDGATDAEIMNEFHEHLKQSIICNENGPQ